MVPLSENTPLGAPLLAVNLSTWLRLERLNLQPVVMIVMQQNILSSRVFFCVQLAYQLLESALTQYCQAKIGRMTRKKQWKQRKT